MSEEAKEQRSWWDFFAETTPVVFSLFKDAYRYQYRQKVDSIIAEMVRSLGNKPFRAIRDKKLLEDMVMAVNLLQFKPEEDEVVFSKGTDGLADCKGVFVLDDDNEDDEDEIRPKARRKKRLIIKTGTLWVWVRGTHTIADVLTDLSWIHETAFIQDGLGPGIPAEVPIGLPGRAQRLATKIYNYISEIEDTSLVPSPEEFAAGKDYPADVLPPVKVTRVCYAGHSLGGAVATVLRLMHSTAQCPYATVPACVFTLGSPLVLAEPDAAVLGLSSPRSAELKASIHNILFQLDVVPRLLGSHPLPDYIYSSVIGDTVRELPHRDCYEPFGEYYLLRASAEPFLQHLPSREHVKVLLSIFPPHGMDFAFSLSHDHRSKEAKASIEKALVHLETKGSLLPSNRLAFAGSSSDRPRSASSRPASARSATEVSIASSGGEAEADSGAGRESLRVVVQGRPVSATVQRSGSTSDSTERLPRPASAQARLVTLTPTNSSSTSSLST